jgi:hypothetical protein
MPIVRSSRAGSDSLFPANGSQLATSRRRSIRTQMSYGLRILPGYLWQRLTRPRPKGPVHLIFALADHFEPSIVQENGLARAPYGEQERRLEFWCCEYPKVADIWRDSDGRPFVHTYFYPAEQYDKGLIDRLAEHCHAGWGEIEVHLHHGIEAADTADNTQRHLLEFRDTLASLHGCLSYLDGTGSPRYAFVHGNFALANSAAGRFCGVDSEMEVLSETGCYADLTLPTATFHPAQIRKINSLYECAQPLAKRAAHRRGRDLRRGQSPRIFPIMVQGPLLFDFGSSSRWASIENGAITRKNPLSVERLRLWKQASICVSGRPDWLFIKLHCHGMDPSQQEAVLGGPMRQFLCDLVTRAQERGETLHFVSAREMVNIILAACDEREGNPGQYRDYRLKPATSVPLESRRRSASQLAAKG